MLDFYYFQALNLVNTLIFSDGLSKHLPVSLQTVTRPASLHPLASSRKPPQMLRA